MAAGNVQVPVTAVVGGVAAVDDLQQRLEKLLQTAAKITAAFAQVRMPRSLPEQKDWNVERDRERSEGVNEALRNRGGTTKDINDQTTVNLGLKQGIADTEQATAQVRGAATSTASRNRLKQAEVVLDQLNAKAGNQRTTTTETKKRLKAGVDAFQARTTIGDTSTVYREGLKTAGSDAREDIRTAGNAQRLADRAADRHDRQRETDERAAARKAKAIEDRQEQNAARASAAAVQAFAIGGPAGLVRHGVGRGVQWGGEHVGKYMQGAATTAQKGWAAWDPLGYGKHISAALGQPPPPGVLAAMGMGTVGKLAGKTLLGAAIGGAVYTGASVYAGYNAIQPLTQKYAGWERGMRGHADLGGYKSVRDFQGSAGAIAADKQHGIGNDEYFDAKHQYLNARGRSWSKAGEAADERSIRAAINQGIPLGLIGQYHRRQDIGGGLSGARSQDVTLGLQQAGLTGSELHGGLQSIMQQSDSAARYGQTYDPTSRVAMQKRLAPTIGISGANRMMEGLQGAGNNSMASIDAALQQIADMSVLAGAASEGGDFLDIRERVGGASGKDKKKWIKSQGAGDLAAGAWGSQAEAKALMGLTDGDMSASLSEDPDRPSVANTFSRIAATGENSRNTMALQGEFAEAIAKLHEAIQNMQMSFGTSLPAGIAEGIINGLQRAAGGYGG